MKKIDESIEKEIILTDILLRLTVLERLLISKGFISQEEFIATTEDMAKKIAKTLLQNANVSGDLDQVIDSFKNKKITEN